MDPPSLGRLRCPEPQVLENAPHDVCILDQAITRIAPPAPGSPTRCGQRPGERQPAARCGGRRRWSSGCVIVQLGRRARPGIGMRDSKGPPRPYLTQLSQLHAAPPESHSQIFSAKAITAAPLQGSTALLRGLIPPYSWRVLRVGFHRHLMHLNLCFQFYGAFLASTLLNFHHRQFRQLWRMTEVPRLSRQSSTIRHHNMAL